jgi:hypothetical protein
MTCRSCNQTSSQCNAITAKGKQCLNLESYDAALAIWPPKGKATKVICGESSLSLCARITSSSEGPEDDVFRMLSDRKWRAGMTRALL